MSKGWLKVATFGLRGGSVSGTLGKEEVSRFEKVGLNMHEVSNIVQAREGWFKNGVKRWLRGWRACGRGTLFHKSFHNSSYIVFRSNSVSVASALHDTLAAATFRWRSSVALRSSGSSLTNLELIGRAYIYRVTSTAHAVVARSEPLRTS